MTTALASLMTRVVRAENAVERARFRQQFNELMMQVQEHDLAAMNRGDASAMYLINMDTIRDRVRANLNPRAGMLRRTRRALRGEQAEEFR